jgi:hypothetical protein
MEGKRRGYKLNTSQCTQLRNEGSDESALGNNEVRGQTIMILSKQLGDQTKVLVDPAVG